MPVRGAIVDQELEQESGGSGKILENAAVSAPKEASEAKAGAKTQR